MNTRNIFHFLNGLGEERFTPLLQAYDASVLVDVDGSDKVSEWGDKNLTGNYLSQPTEANKPTLVANSFNSYSGIKFDGDNSFMNFNEAISGLENCHIFIAAKTEDITKQQVFMSFSESVIFIPQIYESKSALVITPFVYSNPTVLENDTAYIFEFYNSGKDGGIVVNGVDYVFDNENAPTKPELTSIGFFVSSFFLKGTIGEIRIFNNKLVGQQYIDEKEYMSRYL